MAKAKKSEKIRVTQVKSTIDRSKRQKQTLEALGLHRISQSAEHDASPQILGMINKVSHLVKVENI
jgi:large subunit ribosomal protein L30